MRARIVVPVAALCGAAAMLGAGALASGNSASSSRAAAQAGSELQNRALFAVMTGRKEVDSAGNRRVGDENGRGSFTAIADGDQLCYAITVKDIEDPIAAHIHKARPNQAGPIVVPLTAPATGDPGVSSDCVTVADADLLAAILTHPHKYYVNVHNVPFGGGAVRGQLFRKSR